MNLGGDDGGLLGDEGREWRWLASWKIDSCIFLVVVRSRLLWRTDPSA